MKNKIPLILSFLLISLTAICAQDSTATFNHPPNGGDTDLFEIVILIGYVAGVFVLLPIVVYTNVSEKLFIPNEENKNKVQPLKALRQDERNYRAEVILDRIAQNMTPFTDENGNEMITITKGSQARFTKKGLDYINKRLAPNDPEILERIEELSEVYNNRTQRVFTGSKWVIASGLGIGALILLSAGFTPLLIIHLLGLVFYVLSSRTTLFGIQKRMDTYGGGKGFLSTLMTNLFVGDGTRYYRVNSWGGRKRDWETEGSMAIGRLFILLILAIFLGLFATFLGVINFLLNYSTSFLLPFPSEDVWYQKHFSKLPARD